jgi:hypothetical protein
MRVKQGQGRLLAIMALVFVPAFLGWGVGFWISQESIQTRQQTDDEKRLKQTSVQAQMLVEMVSAEVETIRTEAKEFTLKRTDPLRPTPFPLTGRILHWAEVGTDKSTVASLKRVARNPQWTANSATEESYLQSVARNLNVSEVEKQGIEVLRIKQAPGGSSEWLSFAFPAPNEPKTIILALLNPSDAFPSFQKWGRHGQAGKSRSYLIGRDGRVLVHSQSTFNSADFSGTPFFRDQLQKVLNGTWRGGSGDYMGIDQTPVGAAYFRVESLPLVAVVEDVIKPYSFWTIWSQILFRSLYSWVVLGVIVWGAALVLQSYLTRVVTLTVHPESSDDSVPAPRGVPAQPRATLSQTDVFLGRDEFLILDRENPEKNGLL